MNWWTECLQQYKIQCSCIHRHTIWHTHTHTRTYKQQAGRNEGTKMERYTQSYRQTGRHTGRHTHQRPLTNIPIIDSEADIAVADGGGNNGQANVGVVKVSSWFERQGATLRPLLFLYCSMANDTHGLAINLSDWAVAVGIAVQVIWQSKSDTNIGWMLEEHL